MGLWKNHSGYIENRFHVEKCITSFINGTQISFIKNELSRYQDIFFTDETKYCKIYKIIPNRILNEDLIKDIAKIIYQSDGTIEHIYSKLLDFMPKDNIKFLDSDTLSVRSSGMLVFSLFVTDIIP